ncbi:hypothetical protein [Streptomyces sp. NPDC058953]|uniref:hypothetical protein n=1 Tax=unclassified Streptomyces TaxID=2593676 RepID=UPI0036C5FE3B
MADSEGGWRPPGSKHPWIPPGEGGGESSPLNRIAGGGGGGRRPRSKAGYVALILLAIWTVFAMQWREKDCSLIPTSYVLVITHGTPSLFEGCGDHDVNVTDD